MVEGAYIDKFSHVSDMNIMNMIYALMELEETVSYVLDWASQREDTAVIFTADHETGGLQVAPNKDALDNVLYTATYHTSENVPLYLYNITPQEDDYQLSGSTKVFDNTDVYQLAKRVVLN